MSYEGIYRYNVSFRTNITHLDIGSELIEISAKIRFSILDLSIQFATSVI
jgi:hypothetical protein